MATIVAGSSASFVVRVLKDGQPVPVADVTGAAIHSMDGSEELVPNISVDESDPGADWPAGEVAVALAGSQTSGLNPGELILVLQGSFGIRRYRVTVETVFAPTRTSLFIRDLVIDEMRNDRLLAATAGVLENVHVSDDYLWDKVRAAEAEIATTLRVRLVPTKFFPIKPSDEQIAELGGMAWDVDPPYDYQANMFQYDRWGYFITRQRPIIDVESLIFAYPTQDGGFVKIPDDWLRIDSRPGHVRLVPTGPALFLSSTTFVVAGMLGARNIPAMMQLTYTAGLEDAAGKYPQLLDIIKKKAVLKIVQDAYLPQSGSIGADGLSESISVDAAKYQEAIDETLHGPPNSNGGLMAAIHGVRVII